MATKYTAHTSGPTSTILGVRAKKASAIMLGELSGEPYWVTTDTGTIVHDTRPQDPVDEEIRAKIDKSFPDPEPAPVEDDDNPADDLHDTADQEPTTQTATSKFDIDDMKRKVKGLLAKAEGTDNAAERDAFNAKAEKLMLRLGLQRAELEADGEVRPEDIVQTHRDFPGNYAIVMVPFVASVAAGFGHITILQSTFKGQLTRRAWIIGTSTDVETFTILLDSLTRQVMAALRVWQKENIEVRRHQTDMEKYLGHRSFISGFGTACGSRLAKSRKDSEQDASSGAALVLVSKDERVKDYIAQEVGETKAARGGIQKGSFAGRMAGVAAGLKADLGEKSLDSSRPEMG